MKKILKNEVADYPETYICCGTSGEQTSALTMRPIFFYFIEMEQTEFSYSSSTRMIHCPEMTYQIKEKHTYQNN